MALTCSNCGKELRDNAKFCGDCGTPVQEKKPNWCANCFAELPENTKFCLQCGKPAVIAQHNPSPPNLDESLFEELQSTSPQHGILSFEDEGIADFEENRARIIERAKKWVEYLTSGMERIHWFQEFYIFHSTILSKIENYFVLEQSMFRTNKPNHHKAL
jgi:Double zinc ribbon